MLNGLMEIRLHLYRVMLCCRWGNFIVLLLESPQNEGGWVILKGCES